MKIGIYGGSFDPIHKGHIKIARYVINKLGLDKLLIVPSATSPFKQKGKKASNEDRRNMVQLVLEDKMELCDFELRRGGVSYTIDTVKYLKQKYPNDELFLIIGSDHVSSLPSWKDIDLISHLVRIVIVRRDRKINKINIKKYKGILLDNPIFEASSTDFKKGYFGLVDEKVANYIQEHSLYIEQLIHNNLSAKRAKHCVSTANFAAELAKAHKYDAKKAYLAGLMHDICKEYDDEQTLYLINKYEPELAENLPKYKYHQTAGYVWAKYGYKLKDEEILNAILCHTSMKDNMQWLDKILFIADKICEGRRFPGIQKMRELCFKNFEQGFAQVVEVTYQYNIDKGVKFSPDQEKLYNKYRGNK
ncbi:nicotinate-nucleotide adenylyltransferase [Mycoplasmopsis verecunda]|uniref:Probable nicotinate-nucleotide adenylyltransferase n=1 Tax=Mycoplasmopsis verecunda TaxID=171291 RepID=A0A1T4KEJ8_9BACT|nr:nicotinate-nucleotide adenylyltransferase [Mycoplasmopsis verecunda]WPB54875.1 nicotinate-nucleotide adenylyltransferase [Mycoplasmopsis verecunda]SJZ40888.1 nicotinate-nucleotide adenylyltransferase [Mycoplasmopsis verecunda]